MKGDAVVLKPENAFPVTCGFAGAGAGTGAGAGFGELSGDESGDSSPGALGGRITGVVGSDGGEAGVANAGGAAGGGESEDMDGSMLVWGGGGICAGVDGVTEGEGVDG